MDDRDIVMALRTWSEDDVAVQAADYIERLEACVRAGDVLANSTMECVGGEHPWIDVSLKEFDAARSRVNLPATPDSSPSSQAPLDNSNKEARDGKEA